jgi:NADH-quinone oxidoreductase subunit F
MKTDFKPVLLQDYGRENTASLAHYRAGNVGYAAAEKVLRTMKTEEVITQVRLSGLRGRGGAGFVTGVKWAFVPAGSAKPRYFVLNADESEPGTFKDRALMAHTPHNLIEGMIIAAFAIRAHAAYVYIRGEFIREARIMQQAVDEAYAAGLLGKDLFGSGFDLDVTIHRGAGAYICGEETGLLSSLEGDRGYPKIKPPFPAVEGAFQCPTIVNNVETIANVPHIFHRGVDWFKSIGPAGSTGPKIFCLCGHVSRPGLYELPMTVTLRELIYEYAGGVKDGRKLKAVIPGGSSMPVLSADEIDVRMDFDSVQASGSYLGSAGVIAMHDGVDMVKALHNLLRFYHHESCGQCTPCRVGTGWIERIVARIIAGGGRMEDLDTLESVAGQMRGTTICMLSDSAAMPLQSFLKKFRQEFVHYIEHGKPMVEGCAEY